MEKQLYDDDVISLTKIVNTSQKDDVYSNKSFIQLESSILDMASYPNLCQGTMYMFHMEHNGKHILR